MAQRGPRDVVRAPVGRRARLDRRRHRASDEQTLEDYMRSYYGLGDQSRAENGPPGRPTADETCSTTRSTTAARSCCSRCARRSATGVRAARARVGAQVPRRRGDDRRLRRAGLAGRRARSRTVPGRLDLRRRGAGDAEPPGLDPEPSRRPPRRRSSRRRRRRGSSAWRCAAARSPWGFRLPGAAYPDPRLALADAGRRLRRRCCGDLGDLGRRLADADAARLERLLLRLGGAGQFGP